MATEEASNGMRGLSPTKPATWVLGVVARAAIDHPLVTPFDLSEIPSGERAPCYVAP